jgi:hypothetical protein
LVVLAGVDICNLCLDAELAHAFVHTFHCTFPIYAIVLIPENSALVRFRNCRARKHFVMSEIKTDVGSVDSAFDVQTPILENMVVGVPPVFEGLTKQLDKIVEQPLLGPKAKFPAG